MENWDHFHAAFKEAYVFWFQKPSTKRVKQMLLGCIIFTHLHLLIELNYRIEHKIIMYLDLKNH